MNNLLKDVSTLKLIICSDDGCKRDGSLSDENPLPLYAMLCVI